MQRSYGEEGAGDDRDENPRPQKPNSVVRPKPNEIDNKQKQFKRQVSSQQSHKQSKNSAQDNSQANFMVDEMEMLENTQ